MATEQQGAGPNLVAMYERALDGAQRLVGSVQPDELTKPTPCSEWDVRALITHMIGTNTRFAAALAGEQGAAATTTPSAADDLKAAYAASAQAARAAWRAPGALERVLHMPFGEMPGSAAVAVVLTDQLIHTWDLAKALNRDYRLDEDLAATALEFSRQRIGPDRRGPGKPFAAEVACASDAPVQDRLAAFMGRQP
jgi:uncharacterized protein (TIGR03086 family)